MYRVWILLYVKGALTEPCHVWRLNWFQTDRLFLIWGSFKSGMSIRTTISAIAVALALLVLWPAGASAHTGHTHAHAGHAHAGHANMALKSTAAASVAEDAEMPSGTHAELRAQMSALGDASVHWHGANSGCCPSGHCSGCINVIAPLSGTDFNLLVGVSLPLHDLTTPSALAREGPPRPPKSLA